MRCFAVGLLIGTCQLWLFSSLFSVWFYAQIILLLIFLCVTFHQKLARFSIRQPIQYALFGLCIGLLNSQYQSHSSLAHRLPPLQQVLDINMAGRICSLIHKTEESIRFAFCPTEFYSDTEQNFQQIKALKSIHVSWYLHKFKYHQRHHHSQLELTPEQVNKHHFMTSLLPGDQLKLQLRIKAIVSLMNSGGFDRERWVLVNHYDAQGYVLEKEHQPQKMDTKTVFTTSHLVLRLRQNLLDKLTHQMHESSMLRWHLALTMGVRHFLNAEEWQLVRSTGTSHLIAISGLHIGGLFFWVYWVISFLWRRSVYLMNQWPAHSVALIIGWCFAFSYAWLAGFSLPTQRALIALTCYMIMSLFNLNWNRSKLLSVTLAIILIADPVSVLSESFWLSFMAISIIFWLLSTGFIQRDEQSIYKKEYGLKRIGIRLKEWLFIQWGLTVMMSLISALLFFELSVNAFLANLLAVPVITLVVLPMEFMALLMSLFSIEWALLFFQLLDKIIVVLIFCLQKINHYIPTQLLSQPLLFLGIIMSLLLILWPWRQTLSTRSIGLSQYLFIILFVVMINKHKAHATLEMYFMDVGQGLSIIGRYSDVENNTSFVFIYDLGDVYQHMSIAKNVLSPFLKKKLIKEIDLLVISHNDKDHAGDYQWLIQQYPVKYWVSGEKQTLNIQEENKLFKKYESNSCKGKFTIKQLDIEWLQMPNGQGNNASCMMKLSMAGKQILLTGDIEKEAELYILKHHKSFVQADVMTVPHHGSQSSSSWSFLLNSQVKTAIVSSGFLNRFHLPNDKILSRYQALDIELMENSKQGMISLLLTSDGTLQLKGFREEHAHFWYHTF